MGQRASAFRIGRLKARRLIGRNGAARMAARKRVGVSVEQLCSVLLARLAQFMGNNMRAAISFAFCLHQLALFDVLADATRRLAATPPVTA